MNKKTDIDNKFFYITKHSPCPYLDNKLEQKIVAELKGEFANEMYSILTKSGFRRSHKYCYAPICSNCASCVSVRVCVEDFVLSKSFKRIINNNKQFSIKTVSAVADDENFDLFNRYQLSRHFDGDMASMNFDEFKEMIETSPIDTFFMEFRDKNQKLIAVSLCDKTLDGFSAVYSFYEPDLQKNGLGNYMILKLIEKAKENNLPYVYLGYWIAESPKMSYKIRFKPIEALINNDWQLI